jgi:alkanesulfonate monooxygenase SsuD/methylene tetrahydromethanopterin reductase-like flavin-dependent oxidoreductase (luciferase family)
MGLPVARQSSLSLKTIFGYDKFRFLLNPAPEHSLVATRRTIMKLSLAYEMQRPTLDDHAVIEETIEQCILADQMGFDYVWFVEHHFLTGFSMSPCPEVIFGALSKLTKRIRLGFGVVILPYHHPVRVAERVAMVDHLSNGRVDFGTGRSAPYEQTGMGIDPRETREMWEESLTMVPKIWGKGLFSWDGKFWQVPPREVLPKPFQNPHPPIWVAAMQPSTYELAAEKGIGVMALGVSAPSILAPHIKAYHDNVRQAKPVGAFINDQWLSSTMAYCGEDNKAARELAANSLKTFFGPDRPYLKDQVNIYERLVEQWGGVPDHLKANFARYIKKDQLSTGDAPEVDLSGGSGAIAQAIWNQLDADTLANRGVIVAGDPESCLNAIRLHEATGVDQLQFLMATETISHAQVMTSIELFGKYVIPELRQSSHATA